MGSPLQDGYALIMSNLKLSSGTKRPLVDVKSDTIKATRKGVSFELTLVCSKCHLEWRESEMAMFNGKPFGIPCGCSKDIPQLASRGKG